MIRRRYLMSSVLIYAVLIAQAISVLYPLAMMLILSMKTKAEIFMRPLGLPSSPSLDNYIRAWHAARFDLFFRNSAFVSVASVTLILLVSSMASYVLARHRFYGRSFIQVLFLFGLMLSMRLCIIPLFNLIASLGLNDSHLALILIYTAGQLPFSVFMLTNFFQTIPIEIEEAAYLDGCSHMGVYARIILPLMRPALSTVGIFTFVSIWNDFFYPLVFIRTSELRTLPLGIAMFVGEYNTEWGLLFAGITMAVIPTVVVYLTMSRQFIEGLSAGAIK